MPEHSETETLLVLMAKQPAPGRTKTRLIPPLSPTQAAGLYTHFLLDKLAGMRQLAHVRPAIAFTPFRARDYFRSLAPDFDLIPQRGEGLAERLCNLFGKQTGPNCRPVISIDGDSPNLPPEYLQEGVRVLEEAGVDLILGPSEDGGYYAIGMRSLHAPLFALPMSTPTLADDTLARAQAAGLRVHSLPSWYDVDTAPDLNRLQSDLEEGVGFDAEHTAGFIRDQRGHWPVRI
jgi:rSAM/selenodomain-associated transferase 1